MKTLPHLKVWQVVGRLIAPFRRRISILRLPEPPQELAQSLSNHIPFIYHDPWNSESDLGEGRFTFLNRSQELGRPVNWGAEELPLLWRFNLQYFNYLHAVPRTDRVKLCRDWIRSHEIGRGVAWHPYPTSLRMVNWCKERFEEPDILESLYRQASYLYRNLETYVYGNHLIENARALVFAGCTFGDAGEAPMWMRRGLDIFRDEAHEQILVDGGHYERSPMYLAIMLEAWLDVVNVLHESRAERRDIADVARRMDEALRAVTHPDGEISLLNDSTSEIAPSTGRLHTYAGQLGCAGSDVSRQLPETGYFIYQDRDVYLIVDAGPGGPDHLMAHAHADVFTYELSLNGLRFVVDTGVFEYAAGPDRAYCRSTRAHNTVEIDGVDQIECWSSFRVGRRSAPEDVDVRTDSGIWRFNGTFKGYGSIIGDGLRHDRRIEIDGNERSISVLDIVEGRGRHRMASRIRLHPDVRLSRGDVLQLEREGLVCDVRIESGNLRVEDSWYFPEFGRRIPTSVLVIEQEGILPERTEYSFHF